MTRIRRFTWIGLGVIAVANAIALSGAAWNRSGEPESTLALTDRELRIPDSNPDANRENTGLSVRLEWCAQPSRLRPTDDDLREVGVNCYERVPRWFDRERLAAFGFHLDLAPTATGAAEYYNRQLPRPAFVVLELAGPTYQSILDEHRALSATADSVAAAHPDSLSRRRAKTARERLAWFEGQASRLFAVDVGSDLGDLRARYPDRAMYAIVRGTVRPRIMFPENGIVLGEIRELEPAQIQVPKEFRVAFEGLLPRSSYVRQKGIGRAQNREFTIAFGKRLEPWIAGWRKNPD